MQEFVTIDLEREIPYMNKSLHTKKKEYLGKCKHEGIGGKKLQLVLHMQRTSKGLGPITS